MTTEPAKMTHTVTLTGLLRREHEPLAVHVEAGDEIPGERPFFSSST
jgi:hypothetical protein